MTAPDDRELSRLWQEQVDPAEQATLRRLATDIERTALRRRAIDFVMAVVAIGLVAAVMLAHPAPIPVRLALAAAIALILWTMWMRQRLLREARALAACESEAFFAGAIANARAELNYSTFSLWAGGPAGFILFALLVSSDTQAPGDIGLLMRELLGPYARKTAAMIATLAAGYIFFIRANVRLREQVRRLEKMRQEWESEDAAG